MKGLPQFLLTLCWDCLCDARPSREVRRAKQRARLIGCLLLAIAGPSYGVGCGTIPSTYAITSGPGGTLGFGSNTAINGNLPSGSGSSVLPTGVRTNATPTFPGLSPSSFPTFSSSTNSSAYTFAPGTYNNVTVSGSATFSGGTYYINTLTVLGNTAVTFGSGTYYVNSVSIGNSLSVSTSGAVSFYVNTSFSVGGNVGINALGATTDLLLYLYANASFAFSSSGSFKGVIYGPYGGNSVTINDNVGFTGLIAINGGSVSLGNSSGFTLSAADQTAIGNVSTCGSGGGGSSTAAGYNAVDAYLNSYPASATSQRIYTKLAGTSFTLGIAALNSSTPTPGLLSPAYVSGTNKVKVDLVDDSDGTCTSSCSGAACQAKTAVATLNTSFASGDNSFKQGLSFTVSNAYSNLRVRITDSSNSPTVYGCSADSFSVRPTAFSLSSSANADAAGASTGATPAVKTGTNFTLTATAIAGYSGTPSISAASIAVNPSHAGTLAGSFGSANGSTGVASGSFTYSEVGYFSLNADAVNDTTFTTVDQSSDCTADYSNTLVSGKYGCYFSNSTASSYVGRFIPDHFAITPGTVTPACGTFTYFDQDGFTTAFTLAAQNSSNSTTQNYTGTFAKLGLSTWAGFVFTGDTATPSASATAPSGSWNNGTASVTARHQVLVRPTASPVAPASLNVSARPADSDGVTTASPTAVMSAATVLEFGELKLGSANGSNLMALNVPVSANVWNGAGWVTNTADSCTGPALLNASIALGNQTQRPGASGTFSSSTASSPTLASTWSRGAGHLVLAAPGTAGTAQVALNLGSGSTDASCIGWSVATTGSALPWLRGGWCGNTFMKDPSSLAYFGAPATPFVYFRESH